MQGDYEPMKCHLTDVWNKSWEVQDLSQLVADSLPVEFCIFQDVMESSTLAVQFAILLQLETKCFVSCFAVTSWSLISLSQKGINSSYSVCYL